MVSAARFPLPADAPGTALLAEPLQYWEIEVAAELAGVDDHGVFLIPVYVDAAASVPT